MQQAIYNNITTNSITTNSITSSGITIQTTMTNQAAPATRRASLVRRIARRWDMVGVLALMTSSAAYGVFALAHVGL